MKQLLKLAGLFLLLTIYSVKAQTNVTVMYYNGSAQEFTVAAAGKLYFADDNLNIKTDSNTTPTTIPVGIIRKITFGSTLSNAAIGENKNQLAIFPNPGADIIRIHSDYNEKLEVKIYSLNGQLIFSGNYQPDEAIDVSQLASGLYLVQTNGVTLKFSKK